MLCWNNVYALSKLKISLKCSCYTSEIKWPIIILYRNNTGGIKLIKSYHHLISRTVSVSFHLLFRKLLLWKLSRNDLKTTFQCKRSKMEQYRYGLKRRLTYPLPSLNTLQRCSISNHLHCQAAGRSVFKMVFILCWLQKPFNKNAIATTAWNEV